MVVFVDFSLVRKVLVTTTHVWEKWQTPDCSHLDTVCTVNMDSRDEYFAYQRKVEEHNHKVDR